MKTRNILLGLVALIVATGSAFTSWSFASVTSYVDVKFFDDDTWHCTDAQVNCDGSGSTACRIDVFATATNTEKRVNGRLSDCTSVILHANSTPLDSPLSVYDVK